MAQEVLPLETVQVTPVLGNESSLQQLDRAHSYLVACRTGVRATIAASLLDAAGFRVRPVVDGGVPALPAEELEPVHA